MTTSSIAYAGTSPNEDTASISRILATASIVATLVGMLVAFSFGYLLGEPPTLADFVGHHLLPALIISVSVCVTLSLILQSKVITPVREIFRHLYGVGSGRLSQLSLDTRVSEIQTVAEGVNLLVARLKGDPKDGALGMALDDLVKLRGDLEKAAAAPDHTADVFVPAMRDLRRLEGDLLTLMQTGKCGS